MKKTFLKSVATGIVGLTLVASCSMFNKESAHKCSSNTCDGKKEVSDSATKAVKASSTTKKAKKSSKKAPKAEVKTDAKATETKTTDKK